MRLLVVGLLMIALGSAPAVAEPASTPATSPTPTATAAPRIENNVYPQLKGTPRYEQTLTATAGGWWPRPTTIVYRWYRDGVMIPGRTKAWYQPTAADVGHRIQVRVWAGRAGHHTGAASSRAVVIDHVTKVRRTVTYSVRTNGKISTSVSEFKRLAQQTYDDPRGWRANGIRFKQVSSGGDFTLVLAQASKVPTYSSGCSSQWSCRVGRYVIINQDRWKKASTSWNKAKGSLRDYRNMVVNHETGHWLGKGHVGCRKKGTPARVMQQQSKTLGGCTFNPWPTSGERYAPRFSF